MSDIHDLIYRTSKLSYQTGKQREQERVIAILKSLPPLFHHNDYVMRAVAKAISEIKLDDK